MEFTAKLYKIYDIEHVSEKFMKKSFVLLEAYPTRYGEVENFVKFQVTQEKVGQLDGLKVGDEVTVKFNLDGRMWKKDENSEEVCFVNLSAYSVIPTAQTVTAGEVQNPDPAPQPEPSPTAQAPQTGEPVDINKAAGKDDLPF